MTTRMPLIRILRALVAIGCAAAVTPPSVAYADTSSESRTTFTRIAGPVVLAQARSAPRTKSPNPDAMEFESVKNSIALLFRDLSVNTGRSIVLMNGLETTQAGPYEKKKRTPWEWVDQIVTDTGMRVERG